MRRHSILVLAALGLSGACDYGLIVNDRAILSPPRDLAIADPRDGRALSLTWDRSAQGGVSAIRLVRRANERPISPDDANAEVVYEGLDTSFREATPFGTGVAAAKVTRLGVRGDGSIDLSGRFEGTTAFGAEDGARILDASPEGVTGFIARVDATGAVRFVRPARGEHFSVAGLVELGGGGALVAGEFAGTLTLFDADDAVTLEAPENTFSSSPTEGFLAVVTQ